MEKNKQILNEWNQEISKYEKLNFKEAKELYKKYLESNKAKAKMREELILKTQYVIYNFIKNNGLIYMNSYYYDMSDIISTCIEIWIKKIDSGTLLEKESFAEVFDIEFYNNLNEYLNISKDIEESDYMYNIKEFIALIMDYQRLKEASDDYNYYDLVKYMGENEKYHKLLYQINPQYYNLTMHILENKDHYNFWRKRMEEFKKPIEEQNWEPFIEYYNKHIDYDDFIREYRYLEKQIDPYTTKYFELLDKIIDSFELKDNNLNMSKTTLYKLRHLVINNGIEYSRIDINKIKYDFEIEFDKKNLKNELIKTIRNSGKLSKVEENIIYKYFGIYDGEQKTLEAIAKEYGITRNAIRIKQIRAIRKLCYPSVRKELKKLL